MFFFFMYFLTQMVEEGMDGNVVMVTLGAEGGVETVDEEQGTSYMELKPSTTLLVPMELMESHESLVGCPQLGPPELHQATTQDQLTSETHSDFSLMLDVDDEVKDPEMPPLNEDLEFSVPPTLSPAVDDDDPVANSEVILLDKEVQDAPVSGEAREQEQGEETAIMVRADVEGSLADEVNAQILTTDANHEPEDVTNLLSAQLRVEEEEPAGFLMPEASPQQELPEEVAESVAVEEEVRLNDENPESEAHHKEPEENGPVNIDIEGTAISEAESAAVEKNDPKASEPEEDSEEMETDTETKKNPAGRPRKQKDVKEAASSDSQVGEEPVEETPASQEKKSIPPNPPRRTTRGKSVTFISPLSEEKEELQEDEKLVEAQSNVVPVSLRRTPRKSKQNTEAAVTPRRSSRRAQQEPPEEEEPVEAMNQGATVLATSKLAFSGRRRVSQRTASTRSSQSGDQESSGSELGGSEDDVADTKPSRTSSSRTPTPSKRRTPQSSTPRRSSRRILGSVDVVSVPLEIVKEENEQEEVFTSLKRTSKQTKAETAEEQPVLLEEVEEEEEEQKKARASSPGRTTRHSSRNSLTVYSQVRTQKDKKYLSFELSRKHICIFTALDRFMLSIIYCITSSEQQEDEKTHC